MIDMLSGIIDFIGSIIGFIVNTLMSILWIIKSIPSFVTQISSIFVYCPTFLLVWLEVSLALTILFAIIKLIK